VELEGGVGEGGGAGETHPLSKNKTPGMRIKKFQHVGSLQFLSPTQPPPPNVKLLLFSPPPVDITAF